MTPCYAEARRQNGKAEFDVEIAIWRGRMLAGRGSLSTVLTPEDVEGIIAEACQDMPRSNERVLVIIPDRTRTAPIPLLFRLLGEHVGRRVR